MNESAEHTIHAVNYIMQMRPVFNIPALFSDETNMFVSPMEPKPCEKVTIRMRTAKNNVDTVTLITGERRIGMKWEKCDGTFDYYAAEVFVGTEPFCYYFQITSGKLSCCYNKNGVTFENPEESLFTIIPGFRTPDWAKGAVMYQILVDRFRNGDESNDPLDNEYSYLNGMSRRVTDWNRRPASFGVREFYGGDLAGVLEKLDYLSDLGIEAIYFNPLFVSPSNHKYDTQDYDHIDPHFGTFVTDEGELLPDGCTDNKQASRYISRVTRQDNLDSANAMFARVVEECHKRGIKVIIDGVFNHCGSFNKWMDRERIYENQPGYENGAFISADSPYRTFFEFKDENAWPYNTSYDGWWGHETLPKMNFEDSPKLEEYILRIAAKWVSPPYNADGWRLDVAADLGHTPQYNHEFWRKFRQAVKQAKPDAIILAEHYGDPGAWLAGDEWDTVMNYSAFMEPLTWFFTGMEKHSDDYQEGLFGNADFFFDSMRNGMNAFTAPSLQVSMNELSNHDHSRFLTRTNHKVGRMDHFDYDAASDGVNPAVMREAVIMQMTWPGAPTVYYGDEAGVCGFTDPDNRRTYPWGLEDHSMIAFHKAAIAMHKENPVFAHGSLIFLHADYNVLAYGRFNETQSIAVVFNNNPEEKTLEIPVWQTGTGKEAVMTSLLRSDAQGFNTDPKEYPVTDGKVSITMPAFSGVVLNHKKE